MARKITETMAHAFYNNEIKTMSNTRVERKKMYLWSNLIAWVEDKKLKINCCGWATQTTLERLKGLGVNICIKKGKLYLNGEEIDSKKTYIAFDCE